MEQRVLIVCRIDSGFPLMIVFFTVGALLLPLLAPVGAYKNYTVGDDLGWYDTLEKSDVDYQKWVADKNFSLGDFLIFNTDNNHTIVQTFNYTTYKLCDYDDSEDKDTIQWSAADPSNTATHAVTVAVPLEKEGIHYFFSSDYDGEQCLNGQRFQINVTHGQGLPKSLSDTDQAPGPVTPDSGSDGDDSVPDTIVPSNFNNPKEEETDDDVPSGAQTIHKLKFLDRSLIMGVLGCLCWGFFCTVLF